MYSLYSPRVFSQSGSKGNNPTIRRSRGGGASGPYQERKHRDITIHGQLVHVDIQGCIGVTIYFSLLLSRIHSASLDLSSPPLTHLVTLSPCHLVTLSPHHLITSSPLRHDTLHQGTLSTYHSIVLVFATSSSSSSPCPLPVLVLSLSSPCPCPLLVLSLSSSSPRPHPHLILI